MNHKKDSECFDAITKQFNGNKYAALSYVQRKARNYLNETDNIILDSEAVTWALRGERPEIADRQTYSQVKRRYADSYIEEVLCYVDDLEVKRSVRKSIKASRHNQNLVYVYDGELSASRSARVRILTNIIWNELYVQRMRIHEQ